MDNKEPSHVIPAVGGNGFRPGECAGESLPCRPAFCPTGEGYSFSGAKYFSQKFKIA